MEKLPTILLLMNKLSLYFLIFNNSLLNIEISIELLTPIGLTRLKFWGYSPFWLLVKRFPLKNIKQRTVFQISNLYLGLVIDITDSFIIPLKLPRLSPGIYFPPSLLLGYRKSYFSKVELDPQFFPMVFPREEIIFPSIIYD